MTLAPPAPVAPPGVVPRAAGASEPVRRPGPRQAYRDLAWLGLLAVGVLLLAALPLIRTPTFYFWNDTAAGAVGQWYYLGDQLSRGHWPLLDPSLWRGGNVVAEGQIGLFSPLSIAIGVALKIWVELNGDLVVFVTVLKFGFLLCGALGTAALVRSYRAPAWAGFLAGLSGTAGGTTRYLDAASWVTGLEIWALLPVFWWALRRMAGAAVPRVGHLVLALAVGYLLVTTGYVYGCLFVAIVVIACLVDTLLTGRRRRAVAVLGVGACCAVLAITVYLPGVLTAPVTTRGGTDVISDGRMMGDIPGMLIAVLPLPLVASYTCWFLPLVVLVDGHRAARLARSLAGLLSFGALATLWILGPQQLGPLRYPARLMPAYVLVVVVLLCVLLARARVVRPSRTRLLLALGWVLAGTWLAVSRAWPVGGIAVLCAGTVAIGLVVGWTLCRLPVRWFRGVRLRTPVLLAAWLALWTVAVVGVQYAAFPTGPQLNRLMPTSPADYRQQAASTRGDTIVIGNADEDLARDPAISAELLVANLWMVNPASVQNTYSLAGHAAYADRYCFIYNGMTCPRALATLFRREPATGQLRADLLGVSSVVLYRPDFPGLTPSWVPVGWHVAATGRYTQTWVRDQPRPRAGGVVWTSRGTAVTELSRTDNAVALRIDRLARTGGTVVLSRLDYPGYVVSGADIVGPTDGYLLTLRIAPGSVGSTVWVVFRPPGWTIERVSLGLAGLALVAWPGLHALAGRRRRLRWSRA